MGHKVPIGCRGSKRFKAAPRKPFNAERLINEIICPWECRQHISKFGTFHIDPKRYIIIS